MIMIWRLSRIESRPKSHEMQVTFKSVSSKFNMMQFVGDPKKNYSTGNSTQLTFPLTINTKGGKFHGRRVKNFEIALRTGKRTVENEIKNMEGA
jgi:hypothetical protein